MYVHNIGHTVRIHNRALENHQEKMEVTVGLTWEIRISLSHVLKIMSRIS